ncbi:39S ribosomal protein L50, mitochondrial [Melipona quadrifasciata]|uniref:Large ribosomal subunit protein mL50 n=1 Tax=Melipona quadrifasciata TaxID=166423 RepID=A0A0N0BEH0_9HYME|nr:39S ribosomal protein L50, mitochondrial [Melipona quadrifasciata]
MAALIRHGSLVNPLKCSPSILAVNTTSLRYDVTRFKSKKRPYVPTRTYDDEKKSLACKGYQKEYKPPEDLYNRIDKICEQQQIPTAYQTKLDDPLQRFNLFLACEQEFQHPITNSVLYRIRTISDLKKYYRKHVSNVTPLDAMRSMELPKNLHINYDYVRFHPGKCDIKIFLKTISADTHIDDTDTMFNGKTAFPKSSTLVTGLRYKKKYQGHVQENPFLEAMLKI